MIESEIGYEVTHFCPFLSPLRGEIIQIHPNFTNYPFETDTTKQKMSMGHHG